MNVTHNLQKISNFHKNRLVKLIPKKSHLPLSYKAASCCLIWRKVIQNINFLNPHKKQPSSLKFTHRLWDIIIREHRGGGPPLKGSEKTPPGLLGSFTYISLESS